jgi:nitroimidazol reductase NimA-like FMN-containing flavoprotein (pyridoxamine 5'-phosphate oxidase superfamily)
MWSAVAFQDRFPKTARTRLKRIPDRGKYDRDTVYAILDEGLLCHLGFVVDSQPYVIPTSYGRMGDRLYLHGSAASRTLRALGSGIDVCVTVTLADGLVLARSAFHHSFNYRSVLVFGTARPIVDREDKIAALHSFVEHVVPDRWDSIRGPSDQELKATTVLSLALEEASAKVRTGPPLDEQEDYELPVWAGVVPLHSVWGPPVPDQPSTRAPRVSLASAPTPPTSRHRHERPVDPADT